MTINVNFYERGETHPSDCPSPHHLSWWMGVYDKFGMRLASNFAVTCCDDFNWDLNDAAKENAAYWPGQSVYLWLDASLTPTEHLRDMPPANGSYEVDR